MRTVLVFAHECAPFNRPESTIGAQRPAQFAKYLPEFGWRALVLCCDAARRRTVEARDLGAVDAEVDAALETADPAASVLVPTPSLRHDGMLDRAWSALQPDGARRGGRPGRALVYARKAVTTAKFLTGDYSQPWQPCARRAAARVAGRVRVDACLGEHGPDAGLFLGRWFSGRFGVPWVADFRDPILQPFRPLARRLYTPVARRLVATAKATVCVNEPHARLDRDLFGHPAWSIPNGFDPDEFAGAAPALVDADRLVVAYLGSIVPAQKIELFLDGLKLARERLGAASRLRFVYRGDAAERIARYASATGLSDAIDASGRVGRDEALARVRGADLLLVLSLQVDDEFYRHGIYPAKVFEYFGARKPILCVPGDRGLLDELLRETATGVVCDTPAAVADRLVAAHAAWSAGGRLPYEPREEAVARYTRRSLAGRLAEVLDFAAGGPA